MHVCSVPAAGRYISLYSFLSRFNCMNSRAYMSSLQTGSQGGRKIIRRAPRKAKRLGFPGAYSQVMACSISMYCTMWFELTCNDWYYFRNKIEISNDKSHCNAYYTQLPFFKKNLKFLIFEIGFHQFYGNAESRRPGKHEFFCSFLLNTFDIRYWFVVPWVSEVFFSYRRFDCERHPGYKVCRYHHAPPHS